MHTICIVNEWATMQEQADTMFDAHRERKRTQVAMKQETMLA
jgi:hypothetical protein